MKAINQEVRSNVLSSSKYCVASIFQLRRWWSHCVARKAVQEIYKTVPRILATRQLPTWALFRLPQTPAGLPPNMFL
jgi:hypothetical protein